MSRRRALLLAGLLAAAGAGTAAEPEGLPADRRCGLPVFQDALLQAINAARAQTRLCGATAMNAATPLRWNGRLFDAAARHAADMAQHDYLSHTGRDGRSVAQRAQAAGYGWTAIGENLAAGPDSVPEVVAGWLASPGHCANLMKADFAEVAVSCVHRPGNRYGHYWTMVLGHR